MRNHSISLFRIEGSPMLDVSQRAVGSCLILRDSRDGEFAQGVDFYITDADAERLSRAAEAFNREMQCEAVAQPQAAE